MTYNLLDFSGVYNLSFSNLTEESFGVGEFDLDRSYSYSLNHFWVSGSVGGPDFDYIDVIPSGTFVDVRYIFPELSYNFSPDYVTYSVGLTAPDDDDSLVMGDSYFMASYKTSNGSLSVSNGQNLALWGDVDPPAFGSDLVCETIIDSSGTVVGIHFSGTLIADVFDLSASYSFRIDDALDAGTLVEVDVSYSSYDDLTLVVGDVDIPSTPDLPDSTVTDAALTIETIHAGDDFVSSSVSVSGLSSTDVIYNFRAYLYEDGTPLGYIDSDAFSGPFMFWHTTKSKLAPETEYTLVYILLENGEETSVTASQSFTTLASPDTPTVDDTQPSSLLSAILAAINKQNDRQEKEYASIVGILGMLWLRLRYIEENTLTFAPSAEETALKTAIAESVTEFTETFWSDEGGGFGRNNITESGFVLNETKEMFNTGVSVSDFFGMFGTYGWGNWFSAETRDDLDTVPSVSTVTADDELSTYEKNLKEIQSFIGGG